MVALTRRALLARGVVGGAGLMVAACGGGTSAAETRPRLTPAQADRALLAGAFADELVAARQLRGLAAELEGEDRLLVARLAAGDERHAQALRSAIRQLGGPDPEGRGEARVLERRSLAGALGLAEAAARSQLELLPRLAAPEARTLVAYILAEEAAHAGALRAALGRPAVPGAFL